MSKLVIDIGNTNIVIAIRSQDEWLPILRIESNLETDLPTFEKIVQAHFLEIGISRSSISDAIISSVVPDLTDKLVGLVRQLIGLTPTLLDGNLIADLDLGVADPYELGSDLAANAVGAYERYQEAVIIVDFGTALTFTSVDQKGQILGVAIAPGVRTAMQSLSSSTAKLPEIPLEIPAQVIGTDTVSALQAGIMQGYVGLVRHMIDQTKKEMNSNPKVIATGGLSFIFEPLHDVFDALDINLTLHGLLSILKSKN